jgi:hypothetical protein
LRQGIVIGYDAQWNMLWFSPLNGWDDVTAIDTAFSDSGLTCNLGVSVSTDLTIDHQFAVPTAPAQERFRVMGTTAQGRVVQFIGTMEQFLNPESGLIPEGEGFSSEELIDAVFAALGQ